MLWTSSRFYSHDTTTWVRDLTKLNCSRVYGLWLQWKNIIIIGWQAKETNLILFTGNCVYICSHAASSHTICSTLNPNSNTYSHLVTCTAHAHSNKIFTPLFELGVSGLSNAVSSVKSLSSTEHLSRHNFIHWRVDVVSTENQLKAVKALLDRWERW